MRLTGSQIKALYFAHALFIIRTQFGHHRPKSGAVVHFACVGELVGEHIVDQCWIEKHQSPVQAQCAVEFAGAPECFRIGQ